MIEIGVTSESLSKLQKDLAGLTKGGRAKFTKLTSLIVYKDIIKHFQDEKDSDGKKWLDWKYQDGSRGRPRPTRRGGSRMLQDSGELRGSIKPFSNSEEGGVQSDSEYAGFQNDGTSKMVAREFMYVSDAAMRDIEEKALKTIIDDWNS